MHLSSSQTFSSSRLLTRRRGVIRQRAHGVALGIEAEGAGEHATGQRLVRPHIWDIVNEKEPVSDFENEPLLIQLAQVCVTTYQIDGH
uniref:Uncharacterized protein n=1 Tax=Rhizobium leguminosarum TaxID=384 RepID=A0A154IQT2_RHILE|nr:hypothetical protein A4A59_36280 [Rhizobium leguminosarum]